MSPSLPQLLDAAWSHAGNPDLCVAFSGGHDSTALLHALSTVRKGKRALRALHIDHGLHSRSDEWAAICMQFCERLQIPLQTIAVRVTVDGQGPEAAARRVRYAAFTQALRDNEYLTTAQHRDDQAETLLLRLLRGAGPHALGGMRTLRPLGPGQLWRPLLLTPRSTLRNHARAEGLDAIDDPANCDPAMARSYLRNEILPRLQTHWPGATRTLARATQLQRMQADFLDHHAQTALEQLRDAHDRSLHANAWCALHQAVRTRVLECWLHAQGLPAPTCAQRDELERQIREAAADRVPRIAWPGAEVRLWRGRLHAMPPLLPMPEVCCSCWQGPSLELPADCGKLYWVTADATIEPHAAPPLRVRLGVRGLHVRPYGDRHTRTLRNLFQQAAIPPWQRQRCPLLYDCTDTLLAVADLWTTEAGEVLFRQHGLRPYWQRGHCVKTHS